MTNLYHVIKDPVLGAMEFTSQENGWIKPFIDSENFQRLRHIKQLGFADLIFPCAVHTRFSHDIGCCYIASQICNKLELSVEQRQIVILAGLLHDIGHGPFSHAFEEIFYGQCVQHEMWTPMFMQDYADPQFLETFNQNNKNCPLTLEKIDDIRNLIMHTHKDKLLSDIVSSQLDADRLDYLLRDNHFCGVTYGEYDFRWLLHCLTEVNKDGKKHLGITRKGIGVVEQYLMARRLMMRNVYQHGRKYAAEFLLAKFLGYLAQEIIENSAFSKLESNTLIEFLKAMNKFNQAAKKSSDLNQLRTVFLKENYILYKKLCDYDVHLIIRCLAGFDQDHPAITIAKRLHARKLPKVLYLDQSKFVRAEILVKEFKEKNSDKIQDWQIALLKLPHLSYEIEQDPILVKDSHGSIKYLHDDSLMINAISDKCENLFLVCIDAEIVNQPFVMDFIKILKREERGDK